MGDFIVGVLGMYIIYRIGKKIYLEFVKKPKELNSKKEVLISQVKNRENSDIGDIFADITLLKSAKTIEVLLHYYNLILFNHKKMVLLKHTEENAFKRIFSTNFDLTLIDLLNRIEYVELDDHIRLENLETAVLQKLKLIKKYDGVISDDEILTIYNNGYFIGMTEEMVIDSQRGEPNNTEFDVQPNKIKKTLLYGNKSSGDVITLVNGVVTKFIDR